MWKEHMDSQSKVSKTYRNIRVAILAEEPLGWGSGKHYFPMILHYSWEKENVLYEFSYTYIYDVDILNKKLTTNNFDVLLVPGGGVGDGESVAKGFLHVPKIKKWKKAISQFIKDGGGYVGICGGTAMLTELETKRGKPKTFLEKRYDRSSIGVSSVKSYYKEISVPLLYPFQYTHPETIGASAYIFSFSPGKTQDNIFIHTGGVPIDFVINKKHPLFSDIKDTKIRIRWWGGPGLIIPEKRSDDINILAWYPDDALTDKTKTSIVAWRYTGGVYGLFQGFWKACVLMKKHHEPFKHLFLYTYYLAGPWEKTHRRIDTDLAKKASITTEIYPNEHKGRILLCTSHPEYMIWWDGHIEEEPEVKDHMMGEGFHRWHDIRPLSKDLIDEFTATWWIVRRFVAWAAKVPDDHMPPIEKGAIDEKAQRILSENVFWDNTLLNQMKNI
ncbi:MAG: hypothetical protein V1769_03935 [Thermoplasmatota archaeon]